MEEAQIILEHHEQRLNTLERDISDLKAVQSQIQTKRKNIIQCSNIKTFCKQNIKFQKAIDKYKK